MNFLKHLLLSVAAFFGVTLLRVSTRDTGEMAFGFRMPAGFPGDVNRTHPASIEPCVIDSDDPPLSYGIPVVVDSATQGVRQLDSGDNALTTVYGFTVRPYPFQQASASNYGAASFGAATPPVTGPIDVLRLGYMVVKIPAGQNAVKGGPVFVRINNGTVAAPVGGVEAQADGGNTIALDPTRYMFNGTQDANGNTEIAINL